MNDDKFALGKKWFWIGMVFGLNYISGFIYGIALVIEKKHQKEGLVIIAFTLVWLLFTWLILGPWLKESGLLPKVQIIR